MALMLGGWVVKLDIHPQPAERWHDLVVRARIGPVDGGVVWLCWLLLAVGAAWLVWRGRREPLPPTELKPPAQRAPALGGTFRRLVETPRVR